MPKATTFLAAPLLIPQICILYCGCHVTLIVHMVLQLAFDLPQSQPGGLEEVVDKSESEC